MILCCRDYFTERAQTESTIDSFEADVAKSNLFAVLGVLTGLDQYIICGQEDAENIKSFVELVKENAPMTSYQSSDSADDRLFNAVVRDSFYTD